MTTVTMITLALFVANLLFSLITYLVNNLFMKKMDRLAEGIDKMESKFDKMADKLEQYVKVQDHKEDLAEVKRRIDKLEDKGHSF